MAIGPAIHPNCATLHDINNTAVINDVTMLATAVHSVPFREISTASSALECECWGLSLLAMADSLDSVRPRSCFINIFTEFVEYGLRSYRGLRWQCVAIIKIRFFCKNLRVSNRRTNFSFPTEGKTNRDWEIKPIVSSYQLKLRQKATSVGGRSWWKIDSHAQNWWVFEWMNLEDSASCSCKMIIAITKCMVFLYYIQRFRGLAVGNFTLKVWRVVVGNSVKGLVDGNCIQGVKGFAEGK